MSERVNEENVGSINATSDSFYSTTCTLIRTVVNLIGRWKSWQQFSIDSDETTTKKWYRVRRYVKNTRVQLRSYILPPDVRL